MHTFSLRFLPDQLGEGKRVEFESTGIDGALDIARYEKAERPFELWQDGKKLGTVKRIAVGPSDLWQIAPPPSRRPDF